MPLVAAQNYRFPTSDEDYGNFYPTAYVDEGGSDWGCGDIYYSGHHGSDFGVGSWSGMDAGRDIVAAADGLVIYSHDGEYDRCSTGDCEGGDGCGNWVKLQHADGKMTMYCHMKEGSVVPAEGDYVLCGEKMGEVGSSGYSTGPHLHFEVRNASNVYEDPFWGECSAPPSYWVDQGSYGGLPAPVCDGGVEPCTAVAEISCGASIASRNDATGATDAHGYYGCSTYSYSAPELAWSFATDRDETVSMSLTGVAADLDLYVLDDEGCDGQGCAASSTNPDASDEGLSFSATGGHVYTIVVDGWEDAISNFTLTTTCAGAWPGQADTAPVDSATPTDPPEGDTAPETDTSPADWSPGSLVLRDDIGGCGCGGGPATGSAAAIALLTLAGRRRARR